MDKKEYQHNWYLKNKGRLRKNYKIYYEKNKERILTHYQLPKIRKHRIHYLKKWRKENKEKIKQQRIKYFETQRLKILELLGNKCVICGFDKYKSALCIHHKNQDLKKEDNIRFLTQFEKEDKSNLMLVCFNCHQALHNKELRVLKCKKPLKN